MAQLLLSQIINPKIFSVSARCNIVRMSSVLYIVHVIHDKYYYGGGGDMSLFENSPRKWSNSHYQKLFLSLFEKWQNSILSRCSAITSTSNKI